MDSRILYIAGSFDDVGGKNSKIAKIIFDGIGKSEVVYVNGGSFTELEEVIDKIQEFNLIYWFGNVPNDKPKLVKEIKKKNKACVLVTSKRNVEKEYSFEDLLYHALGNKSNLFLEITKEDNKYRGRVIDPLGNVFLNYETDFGLVGNALQKKAKELLSYTRVSSRKCGDGIKVPDEEDFFQIIREYGNVFHDLVHANPEAANRFFGNASFRTGDLIFVTKRNIDKRDINNKGFVGVKKIIPVEYFGDQKPSVDTPIQVKLYEYYQNVNFMLHSHTYVKDALFTNRAVPCGALEEADEIFNLFPNKDTVNFFVNLKGHGSLALVDMVKELKGIQYFAREMPEIHDLK